jgi:5'-nucleotidase
MGKPILLLDMDGTGAQFDAYLYSVLYQRYPDVEWKPISEHTEPYFRKNYPDEQRANIIHKTQSEAGFFKNLPPEEGFPQAIQEMFDLGYEPYICSRPLLSNPTCAMDKYIWVKEHLGPSMARRVFLAVDKTCVVGDVLIDDYPMIEGHIQPPSWVHIVFDRPYNRGVPGHRLKRWSDWRAVVEGALRNK